MGCIDRRGREPISRFDNKTHICSSCGIRQSLEPLRGVMDESEIEEIEEIIAKNKEMHRVVNGT